MIDLGKDAAFIWTAYGVSAVLLLTLVINAWRKPRQK